MAKKSLGYTRLIWTCPNCRTRNPGPKKICISCGSAQPKDVHFEAAGQDELIRDESELQYAKAGADIHCPFCGTRNPADAKTCSQCLGDISEGVRRERGRVVAALRTEPSPPVICPSCQGENTANASKCRQCGSPLGGTQKDKVAHVKKPMSDSARLILIGLGVSLVICLGFFISRAFSGSELYGRVNQTNWERSIQILQYQEVEKGDWWDKLPDDADVNDCEERFRFSSDQPVEDAVEICGTPYTVDQGSGYAEVVQDCTYEVYDYYCEYETADWVAAPPLVLQGSGLNASWPSAVENNTQRLGDRSERYTIVFQTEDGINRFTTSDYQLFQQAQIGSEWDLAVDGFGNIKSISHR